MHAVFNNHLVFHLEIEELYIHPLAGMPKLFSYLTGMFLKLKPD